MPLRERVEYCSILTFYWIFQTKLLWHIFSDMTWSNHKPDFLLRESLIEENFCHLSEVSSVLPATTPI